MHVPAAESTMSVPVRHLTAELVAAYVDGALDGRDRGEVEAHLVACDDCRSEMRAAARLVDDAPSGASPRLRKWAYVAAGVAAIAVALPMVSSRRPSRISPERRPASEERSTVRTISPRTEARATRVTFIWARDVDATYQLTLADSSGSLLWSVRTADTVAVVPESIHLAAGARYFWYVDALRKDGTSLGSGQTEFRIRR
ncbi:MAG TPA: zf-HC2 domain-containing protein [Gemmatimonadaceae bacterium]|nr:zf-HC2 domain-containing protein [Gemmatimonadaceae bacterium]